MPIPGLPLDAFIQQLYLQEYAARRLYKTYVVQRQRTDTYSGYGDRSPNRSYNNRSPSGPYQNPSYGYRSLNGYQNGNAYGNRPTGYGQRSGYGQSPRSSDRQYDPQGAPPTPPRRAIRAPKDQRGPFRPRDANYDNNANTQYARGP